MNWTEKYKTVLNEQVDPMQEIDEFLQSLSPEDVGMEQFGDFLVLFEGFSDMCNYDAERRMMLPPNDPAYVSCIEDVYAEVLREFKERAAQHGFEKFIRDGQAGVWGNPVVYAIFSR